MDIAIAGATGVIGSEIARIAVDRGHGIRTLSRAAGVDVFTGVGLDAAVRGCDAVVDALSIPTQNARTSIVFFEETTRRLLDAEQRAGVGHHCALSIVGIERAPHGYYLGKIAQERAVANGPVPWTILQTTQVHDFARQMYDRNAWGPIHPVVAARFQPVSRTEVAQRIIELVEGGPAGRASALAGPREEDLGTAIREWARHTGRRGWMPRLWLPGPFGSALRDGALVPDAAADRGRVTFDQWLSKQPVG